MKDKKVLPPTYSNVFVYSHRNHGGTPFSRPGGKHHRVALEPVGTDSFCNRGRYQPYH